MDNDKLDFVEGTETAESSKETAQDMSLDLESRAYREILAADLKNPNFILPTMIRIMGEKPPKYEKLNAIGYISEFKDFRILNIFRENLEDYGLEFYPHDGYDLYYIDSGNFSRYIALDEYFSYLRAARVEELQQIVGALGAKQYQIAYLFQKPYFAAIKEETGFAFLTRLFDKKPAEVEVKRGLEEEDIDYMEIVSGTGDEGHDPEEPELRYLKKDPSVQTLISQRMDPNGPQPQSKYILKLIDSCGIKPATAATIDTAMKEMKFSGNTTVSCESMNEGRRYLVLTVEF